MYVSQDNDANRRLALFGAPLDTGNLGVSALGLATFAGLHGQIPNLDLTVFDSGRGTRSLEIDYPSGPMVATQRGAWFSRRIYRSESLWVTYAASFVGARKNPNLACIDSAEAVLDISGGDSFSDIYGARRFAAVMMPKRIALRRQRPLVLLPQTFGPFRKRSAFELGRRIVTASAGAWARDADSYEQLMRLAGDDFDATRHRQGVDVALALPSRIPAEASQLVDWLHDDVPVAGLNVSGLLALDPAAARDRFGLRADYFKVMVELAERLLGDGVRVLLVPHVVGNGPETDDLACHRLRDHLGNSDNLRVTPPGLDAMETKWVISQLDWFTGARMHATIAALSSLVPVSVIAYSNKAEGVFDTCGASSEVFDARTLKSSELLESIWTSWQEREAVHERLLVTVPPVTAQALSQFEQIVQQVPQEAPPGMP